MVPRSQVYICSILVLVFLSPFITALHGQTDQASGKLLINVNTASVDELVLLPGIGPATAKRIVEYREEHGPFRRIEDLMNVRGIGRERELRRPRHHLDRLCEPAELFFAAAQVGFDSFVVGDVPHHGTRSYEPAAVVVNR